MNSLTGKVAVITGASRGIGAATAQALAEQGVKVGLGSRSGDDLGLDGAIGVRCDVRDRSQVHALVDQTVAAFGRLDIVIANAGIGKYASLLDTPENDLDEMIDVNLKGTVWAVRAALPHLVAAGGGDALAVASEAGRRGFAGEAVYCATKFGQVGLMRALDRELRDQGVRCTSVCPGGVATDFAMGSGREPGMPELDGMLKAEDVANVIVFILQQPQSSRLLEVAFRGPGEASAG